eukprot:gene5058-5299_t
MAGLLPLQLQAAALAANLGRSYYSRLSSSDDGDWRPNIACLSCITSCTAAVPDRTPVHQPLSPVRRALKTWNPLYNHLEGSRTMNDHVLSFNLASLKVGANISIDWEGRFHSCSTPATISSNEQEQQFVGYEQPAAAVQHLTTSDESYAESMSLSTAITSSEDSGEQLSEHRQDRILIWFQQKLRMLDLAKRRLAVKQVLFEADAAMLRAMNSDLRSRWWEKHGRELCQLDPDDNTVDELLKQEPGWYNI